MSDDWNSYLQLVEGRLASILVDMGIAQEAPIARYPTMAYLRLSMRRPRPDGLSSQEEFDDLGALEDELTQAAQHTGKAVHVGCSTTSGIRDFVFYCRDSSIEAVLRDAMARWPSYTFETGSRPDPEWPDLIRNGRCSGTSSTPRRNSSSRSPIETCRFSCCKRVTGSTVRGSSITSRSSPPNRRVTPLQRMSKVEASPLRIGAATIGPPSSSPGTIAPTRWTRLAPNYSGVQSGTAAGMMVGVRGGSLTAGSDRIPAAFLLRPAPPRPAPPRPALPCPHSLVPPPDHPHSSGNPQRMCFVNKLAPTCLFAPVPLSAPASSTRDICRPGQQGCQGWF